MSNVLNYYKEFGVKQIKLWVNQAKSTYGKYAVNGYVSYEDDFEYSTSRWVYAPTEKMALDVFRKDFHEQMIVDSVMLKKRKMVDVDKFLEACGLVEEEVSHVKELAKGDAAIKKVIDESAYQYFIH
jgi:hypothetical protein